MLFGHFFARASDLIRALPRSSPAALAGHHLSAGSQPDRIQHFEALLGECFTRPSDFGWEIS
jgi:hypothetical protein